MNLIRVTLLIVLATFILSGCKSTTPEPPHPQPHFILEISKPVLDDDSSYKKYRTIKDTKILKEIQIILKQAEVSNAMVSMSRSPDRKISIINTDPTASAEPRNYGIWHSPESNLIEVISENTGGGYGQLNQKDSNKMKAILE